MTAASSPCTGVCRIGPDGLCEGCCRTLAEIGAWASLPETERRAVMRVLPARRPVRDADAPAPLRAGATAPR